MQEVEDLLRTHLAALEHRVKAEIPSTHPNLKWMVENVATTLNKYAVHDDDTTSYENLHGRRATEKLAEFGERILFRIPPKRRAKLDLRWGSGVYLGTAMHSNECFVGLKSGDVTRARSIVRIRPDLRWDLKWVERLTGTPSRQVANNPDAIIEAYAEPHLDLDAEQRAQLEAEDFSDEETQQESPMPAIPADKDLPSLRITRKDLETHGFTEGCPRCTQIELGNCQTGSNHSVVCRARVYARMHATKDPKLLKWLKDHPNQHYKVSPAAKENGSPRQLHRSYASSTRRT